VPILLPIASVYISLILLACVGTGIGLLSGLFGVGGGFLLTPLLMMTGVPATVAAASVSCQMVASSSSGVAAHFRLGHVDLKIGSVLLIGGLAGGGMGVEAIKFLRTIGEADLTITITYIVVLGILGSFMFYESLCTLRHGAIERAPRRSTYVGSLLARLPWQMEFPVSGVKHSILVPLILAVLAGILAAVMGVGGGFIMLPLMIYLLGMSTHVAVGTSLFQILFMSAGVTFMQADANHTVDLLLVLPLALCSAMGAQLGARLSRLLRGEQLVILLATLVLAVTGEMAVSLFTKPRSHLTPVEMSQNLKLLSPSKQCTLREDRLQPPPPLGVVDLRGDGSSTNQRWKPLGNKTLSADLREVKTPNSLRSGTSETVFSRFTEAVASVRTVLKFSRPVVLITGVGNLPRSSLLLRRSVPKPTIRDLADSQWDFQG
jgi:uncharacterized protein